MSQHASAELLSSDVVGNIHIDQNIAFLSLSGLPGVGLTHLKRIISKRCPSMQVIRRVPTDPPRSAAEYLASNHRHGVSRKDFHSGLLRLKPSIVQLHHNAVEVFRWEVKAASGKRVVSILLTCEDEDIFLHRIEQKGWKMSDLNIGDVLLRQEEYRRSEVYDKVIRDNGDATDDELFDQVMECLSRPIVS